MLSTDSRTILTSAIRQTLAGNAYSASINELMANPVALSSLERSAWLQLQNWRADEGLRLQCPSHADFGKKRLSQLLTMLER